MNQNKRTWTQLSDDSLRALVNWDSQRELFPVQLSTPQYPAPGERRWHTSTNPLHTSGFGEPVMVHTSVEWACPAARVIEEHVCTSARTHYATVHICCVNHSMLRGAVSTSSSSSIHMDKATLCPCVSFLWQPLQVCLASPRTVRCETS